MFLIKPLSLYDQKFKIKILNILRKKIAFKMKWKAFFIIFKRLSLKTIFLEGEDFNA